MTLALTILLTVVIFCIGAWVWANGDCLVPYFLTFLGWGLLLFASIIMAKGIVAMVMG